MAHVFEFGAVLMPRRCPGGVEPGRDDVGILPGASASIKDGDRACEPDLSA